MNPPAKKQTESRHELVDFLSAIDADASVKGSTAWHEKKVSPAPDAGPFRNYVQTFARPERYYSAELWPWYLRGPFCAWLRNWYARRHPEIFGSDYGT